MKSFFKILLVIIVVASIAGYIYWQRNKKNIIRNAVQQTVQKKSDSLYFIHYDSSEIDEINGSASFYKITLQSDSVQKQLLQHADSLPGSIFNIRAEEITAKGVNVPGLLQQQQVTARSVTIRHPVIQIINTGEGKPKPFTYDDTLALYKKILGRFKSISADTIQVTGGTVLIKDKKGSALTTIENINITLSNFLIDSTKNYQHIIDYFVNDVVASVENIQLPPAGGIRVNITNLLYNARQKILRVDAVQQYRAGNTSPVANIKNIHISQLNTDAFIRSQQLKASEVAADGGFVTIYKKSKKNKSGNTQILSAGSLIDNAQIAAVELGKTRVVLINTLQPGQPRFEINDVQLKATRISANTNGNTLGEIAGNADCMLSAGSFAFANKHESYRFVAKDIRVNNKTGVARINSILYKPLLTETAFVKQNTTQKDRYDFVFSNIVLSGINFSKFLSDNLLEMTAASFTPVLKIANDRTLPAETVVNTGKYLFQSLSKIPLPVAISKIIISNGSVLYTERGSKSRKTGTVAFTAINAEINNLTNIAEKIKDNGIMLLNARAKFLGIADVETTWQMPLNNTDTTFKVSGQMAKMDATLLNRITEPLALAAVKTGTISGLEFNLKGNNFTAGGDATFLYNGLNISFLKMTDNGDMKKRGLPSLIANALMRDDNPKNNKTYTADINVTRDAGSSFFSLLWKCIFDGVKSTVLRK